MIFRASACFGVIFALCVANQAYADNVSFISGGGNGPTVYVSSANPLPVTGGGGGGGAVTIANGADVVEGALANPATCAVGNTVIACLRQVDADIKNIGAVTIANGADVALGSLTDAASCVSGTTLMACMRQVDADVKGSIPAGTNTIGNVIITGTATPIAGSVSAITTGGTAVTAIAANAKGCIIQNPLTTTDQGIGTVEPLYINQVTTATTTGNTTTFALAPGQTYNCIPFSTLAVSVNAATSAHKFTVTSW